MPINAHFAGGFISGTHRSKSISKQFQRINLTNPESRDPGTNKSRQHIL
jgi:hypothetical protein